MTNSAGVFDLRESSPRNTCRTASITNSSLTPLLLGSGLICSGLQARWIKSQQHTAFRQSVPICLVGQKAEVTDTQKAFWKHMEKETTNEGLGNKSHYLFFAVLVCEGALTRHPVSGGLERDRVIRYSYSCTGLPERMDFLGRFS